MVVTEVLESVTRNGVLTPFSVVAAGYGVARRSSYYLLHISKPLKVVGARRSTTGILRGTSPPFDRLRVRHVYRQRGVPNSPTPESRQ